MAKAFLARGQITITSPRDAYTFTQSCGNYIFSAASDGEITAAVSVTSKISVTQGDLPVSSFRIDIDLSGTDLSGVDACC